MTNAAPVSSPSSLTAAPVLQESVAGGVGFWIAGNIPVLLGVCLGFYVLEPGKPVPYGAESLLLRFCAWDGGQFMDILNRGYRFDPARISNVALFPGFPALAALVQSVTGASGPLSLLVVAQTSWCGALIVWHRYLSIRFPRQPAMAFYGLAALTFYPPAFFLRMAYSEPLFLLLSATILLGFLQCWRPALLALLIGASVSVRLVGIAFVLPFLLYVFSRETNLRPKLVTAICCLPLCVWGLFAYMAFLWIHFDNPFVFRDAQDNFFLRPPVAPLQHWYRLATLEPLWGNYHPASSAYWQQHDTQLPAFLSLQFANPIWFCVIVAATLGGWLRRVLTDAEFLLAAGLLGLAYVGRAEEFCMGGQARYSLAAIPAFIVVGRLYQRTSRAIQLSVASFCVALLTSYSALFAAWYFFV